MIHIPLPRVFMTYSSVNAHIMIHTPPGIHDGSTNMPHPLGYCWKHRYLINNENLITKTIYMIHWHYHWLWHLTNWVHQLHSSPIYINEEFSVILQYSSTVYSFIMFLWLCLCSTNQNWHTNIKASVPVCAYFRLWHFHTRPGSNSCITFKYFTESMKILASKERK